MRNQIMRNQIKGAQMSLSKSHIHATREHFFDALIDEWSRPAGKIDLLMGEADSFFPIDQPPLGHRIKDVAHGALVASATPPLAWGDQPQLIYSVFQAGDWLRISLILRGTPAAMLLFSQNQDELAGIERLFDRQAEVEVRQNAGLLVEWRFIEPDFYENYAIQERFIQVARHMHLRLCRILSASRIV
jgi:hypothetical protein